MTRNFSANDAVREQVPVLFGLDGPSSSGKTFTALRIAKGMQEIIGGDIYGIDTEAKRMLHYAEEFKFKHVPFSAPFGALDYLEALQYCAKQGAKIIITDSMSHEHEGPGGLLDAAETELKRLAGDDYGTWKADKYKMQSWIRPKAARRTLINGLLQINANMIFCFRCKETAKPVKVTNPETGRAKTEIVSMGFTPIAGEEFVFEMTANCFLPPASGGVPDWKSDQPGERMMMKIPIQFKGMLDSGKPLDESVGRALAIWARGEDPGRSAQEQGGSSIRADERSVPQDRKSPGVASPAPKTPPAPPPAEGFTFKAKSATGVVSETRDGAKWRDGLIRMLASPVDFATARDRWKRNEEYVDAAFAAGKSDFAIPVEAEWRKREKEHSNA